MADTEKRPVRVCDSCGGVDDHPRHVVAYAGDEGKSRAEVLEKALENATTKEARKAVLAHASDDTVLIKHMDCCREDGCPDGSCDEVTKGAEDKRGNDLLKHLTKEK